MNTISQVSPAQFIEWSSTSLAIGVFFFFWIRESLKGGSADLRLLLSKALKAGTLPTALVLVLCGFDTQILQYLKGVGTYLAIAGLATGFVAFKAIGE